MHFRKKPIVIEAVRFYRTVDGLVTVDGGSIGLLGFPAWLTEALDAPQDQPGAIFPASDGDGANIFTKEGIHYATPGDWIIRGVKGELYPCKPDIFEATYEPA
jgi:hypothetical protein